MTLHVNAFTVMSQLEIAGTYGIHINYRHIKCNEQMYYVFRNVVDSKTFPSARPYPTF